MSLTIQGVENSFQEGINAPCSLKQTLGNAYKTIFIKNYCNGEIMTIGYKPRHILSNGHNIEHNRSNIRASKNKVIFLYLNKAGETNILIVRPHT